MRLPRAEHALKQLVGWLSTNGFLTDPQGFAIEHSTTQDKLNKQSPRSFCYVTPGEGIIYCTKELENLPDRALVGILLHEMGHIELGAFEGDESEVDVDEWGVSIEEAGYRYEDVTYPQGGAQMVVAKNIEVVSEPFAELILRTYPTG